MNSGMRLQNWLSEVEHELILMGLSGEEALNAVNNNHDSLRQQFDADVAPTVAADLWRADNRVS